MILCSGNTPDIWVVVVVVVGGGWWVCGGTERKTIVLEEWGGEKERVKQREIVSTDRVGKRCMVKEGEGS